MPPSPAATSAWQCASGSRQMKRGGSGRGSEPPLGKRIWGDDEFPRGLNVDSGGDRLELEPPFAQIRNLDPAACRRQAAGGRVAGQRKALELEPPVPAFQPAPAGSREPCGPS